MRSKFFLWVLMLSIPGGALLGTELIARYVCPTAGDPYLNLVDVPAYFGVREIDGRRYYQATHPEAYRGREILFPVEKPPDTFRVFVLGESASAGWPHPPTEVFSVYLQQALARSFPARHVEILNVSAPAYAAYRVRLIFNQVLEFEPDALVIWTGNNEFLERRSYLPFSSTVEEAFALANRLAVFRVMRRYLTPVLAPRNTLSAQARESAMEDVQARIRQETVALRADPLQFDRVSDHYRASVEGMVSEADRRGIPVILLTVPVNLRDWHPNVSNNRLVGGDLQRWERVFDAGRAALLRADAVGAVRAFREALRLEPQHAESQFLLGRALEAQGTWEDAIRSYEQARELDYNPFRALGAFNRVVRQIASRHANVTLADSEQAFLDASAPRAPGFDLLLDYVHPSKAGNLVVARTVFDAFVRSSQLGPPTGVAEFTYTPAAYFPDGSPYTDERDTSMQANLALLMFIMHQYDAVVATARKIVGAEPPLAPNVAARLGEFLDVIPRYLDLDRRRLLELPIDPADAAVIEADFRRLYQVGPPDGGVLRGGATARRESQ